MSDSCNSYSSNQLCQELSIPECATTDPDMQMILTQPNVSVTILAPNHNYMINANSTLWPLSEHTPSKLKAHSEIFQSKLRANSEQTLSTL